MTLAPANERDRVAEPSSEPRRPELARGIHHVGVQTPDLANSMAWYCDFFDAAMTWQLSRFSPLTISRLPGISNLVELVAGPVRFHLIERAGVASRPLAADAIQYQHLCLQVDSAGELNAWREHWLALFQTGKYAFALDALATDIVTDDDGIASFYCYDVNGLEFEFTYVPDVAS